MAALAACSSGGSGTSSPWVLKVWWYEGPGSFFLVFQRTLTRGITVGAVK